MIGASSVVTSQASQANNAMSNSPADPITSAVAVIIIGILIVILVYCLRE